MSQNPQAQKKMTFLDHLEELRRYFIRSLLLLFAGTLACLYWAPEIYDWLKEPLATVLPEGSSFIATGPFEIYLAYFKVALVFGFFLSSPFIFYYFWSFIRPGLMPHEKRGVLPIALLCALLFVGGALFGYFIVFPLGFQLTVKLLALSDIRLFPKTSEYLGLSLRLLIAFGITFDLPMILFLLGRFGLVSSHQLRKARPFIIVGIVLLAAILTPPDVFSQILMAIPLMILFEVGILLVRLTERKRAMVTEATS